MLRSLDRVGPAVTRHGPLARPFLVAAVAVGLSAGAGRAAAASSPTLADDRVEASYNSGRLFVHDAGLDLLLARVGKRIQDANPDAQCVALRVHALDQPIPYSFGLRNGAFYVSTGLIARIDSEAELAALVALPLAALCRGDVDKLQSDQRRYMIKNFVPDLLLGTLTIGMAGPSLRKSREHQEDLDREQIRNASDTAALHWLAAAGYDPGAAPIATAHLLHSLEEEDRSGDAEFSNPEELTARHDALAAIVATMESDPPIAAPPAQAVAGDPLPALSQRYALMLARSDVDAHPSGLLPLLDRIDARGGPTGYTAYLRAELARRNSGSDAGVALAIAAYEKCVRFSDAPPDAYRELGFLHRRAGDQAHARDAFRQYLQKSPNAVDAAIIRTYLEVP